VAGHAWPPTGRAGAFHRSAMPLPAGLAAQPELLA